LSVSYRNRKIIDQLDLSLKPGTITGIVGLSGCGKTTLLSAINGVLKERNQSTMSGEIIYKNRKLDSLSVMEISSTIGTVYQDPDKQIVFSSVLAELSFALENICLSTEEILSKVNHVVQVLDIVELLDRNPQTLSGGEKQLVVLASILVMGVDVLLLDEIMAQVDERACDLIQSRLIKLRDEGKTILMIDHELDHLQMADHIYYLNQGRLKDFNGEF